MNSWYLLVAALDTSPLPRVSADNAALKNILAIVFAVFGAVAFLIIVFAGFKYVISRGNPEAVTKAKNTIIYAAVGLIVALSAEGIIAFTVGRL